WQEQPPNTNSQSWQPQDYNQPTQQHPNYPPQQPFSQPQQNQQQPPWSQQPGQFQPPPQQTRPLPHSRFMAWLNKPSRSRTLLLGCLLPLCIVSCSVIAGVSAFSGTQHTQTIQATPTD